MNFINTVLASGSPRRKEILKMLGIDFSVMVSSAEENIEKNIEPHLLVQELALLKASDIAKKCNDSLVIGADTIVYFESKALGKPINEDDALEMLSLLSGNYHTVYTGIAVINTKTGKAVCAYEKTDVFMKKINEEEIKAYIKTGEPMDKAGSYAVQGKGALLIEKISGDFYNVVGLPVFKLNELLNKEFNYSIFRG